MQFGDRPRPPIVRKPKSPPPLSVGRHAFVNRITTGKQDPGDVHLTDEHDTQMLRELADGQEVEILGWRQRPRVRYHVRCVSGGTEGWVAAEWLRASRDPLPDTPPAGSVRKGPEERAEIRPSRPAASGKRRPRVP